MVLLKINEGGYKAIRPLLCSICSHSVLHSLYCICLDYSAGGGGGGFRCVIALSTVSE